MDINRGNLDLLFKGFNRNFTDGFGMAPDEWTRFAMTVPSKTAIEIFAWLVDFTGMREWIGDRAIDNLETYKMEVANKDYEKTVKVKKNDIEDDTYGIYGKRFQKLGQVSGKLWNDLAHAALVDTSSTWVDGLTFYSTTRTYGDNTISNKTTSALSDTTFQAAYVAMMSYLGYGNQPMGVVPKTLIVGPKLRKTALNIVDNPFTYSSTDKVQIANLDRGIVDVVIDPELIGDYDDYWFLSAGDGIYEPIAVQQRQKPKLTRMDNDNDENVFMRKEYLYGTDARGRAFQVLPHLIYGGIVA